MAWHGILLLSRSFFVNLVWHHGADSLVRRCIGQRPGRSRDWLSTFLTSLGFPQSPLSFVGIRGRQGSRGNFPWPPGWPPLLRASHERTSCTVLKPIDLSGVRACCNDPPSPYRQRRRASQRPSAPSRASETVVSSFAACSTLAGPALEDWHSSMDLSRTKGPS